MVTVGGAMDEEVEEVGALLAAVQGKEKGGDETSSLVDSFWFGQSPSDTRRQLFLNGGA